MRLIYHEDFRVPNSDNVKALFASALNKKKEIMISGGRGKGKTVAIWTYILFLCTRIPGFRVIVARSDYSLIGGTVIETLQERVFKYPLGDSTWRHPKNPCVLVGGINAPKRLVFNNDSEVRFTGLRDPNKLRGTECDLFWLNEGTTERTGAAWRVIGGSTAGARGGNWYINGDRFQQLIVDSNPDVPWHWLHKNFFPDDARKDYIPDEKLWLKFTHHDNVSLVEPCGRRLNARGEQTIEDLIRVYGESGFEADRMIWGKWTAAAGLVYSMYNPDVHEKVMHRDDFGTDTLWHGYQDMGGGGTRSPFAIGIIAQTGNTFHLFKELVMSNAIHADVITRLKADLVRWNIPVSSLDTHVCDDNVPSFCTELREAGFPVVEADKRDKKAIIDSMKGVIRDGRFFVNRYSLEERCPFYDGPQGLKQEILGYAYLPEEEQRLSLKPDIPIETENHSLDGCGYSLHHLRDTVHIPRRTQFIARFPSRRR